LAMMNSSSQPPRPRGRSLAMMNSSRHPPRPQHCQQRQPTVPCHIRPRETSKLVVVVRKLRAPFCNAYLGLCSACVHPGVDRAGFEALVVCRGVIALMPISGVLRAERHLLAPGCTCAVREVQKVPNLTFAVFFALADEFVILLLASSVRSRKKL
jgi:hypothetical protein